MAIFIIASTLSSVFMVSPVDGAMVFNEVQITSNTAAQENPDIYEYGLNNYAIVWQDNRNGNWDIYMFYENYLGNGSWDVRPDVRITTLGNNTNPKISGDTIVYQSDRSGNWDIYMYNLTSKVETQITNSIASQEFPAVDGNIIAWQDDGDGNIYVYNMTTQIQQPITTSGSCHNPSVSGNRIVYDKVKTYIGDPWNNIWTDYYIYCFDLSTSQEIVIAQPARTKEYSMISDLLANPVIYGDQVVWARDSWSLSSDKYSFRYEWNVYLGIVGGGAYWSTSASIADQQYPDIFERYVVYQDDRNRVNGGDEIYLYSIDARAEYRVTNNYYAQQRPAIYGNYIVYMDNRNLNWDIYMTIFSYSVGATSPNPQSTPNSVKENMPVGLTVVILSVASAAIVATVILMGYFKKRKN